MVNACPVCMQIIVGVGAQLMISWYLRVYKSDVFDIGHFWEVCLYPTLIGINWTNNMKHTHWIGTYIHIQQYD